MISPKRREEKEEKQMPKKNGLKIQENPYLKRVMSEMHARNMLESYATLDSYKPIDFNRLDYGQFGNHTKQRPYDTILDGMIWYMNKCPCVIDEMYIHCVAHNFGISIKEAEEKLLCELDRASVQFN